MTKLFGKNEKQTETLIEEHIKTIAKSLKAFRIAFRNYLKDNLDEVSKLCLAVHRLEGKADEILRSIEHQLHEGAFMSVMRVELAMFVEAMDAIANKAESAADTLTLEKPVIPESLQDDFKRIVKYSTHSIDPYIDIGPILKRDYKDLVAIAQDVENLESKVDRIEWKLISKIFEEDIELAHKIQLRSFVNAIADISDAAENASDYLELLVLKRRV